MNIEQERSAFEWWASDEGESPRATERVGGSYKLAQIQSYWMAWQARAALMAESERLKAGRVDLEQFRNAVMFHLSDAQQSSEVEDGERLLALIDAHKGE